MNRLKKLSAALITLTALLGCGEREDPNKIQTIVLDNGKIQRTLRVPSGYIQTKGVGERTNYSIWVHFVYPSMSPFRGTPKEDSVSVLIRLNQGPSTPSFSELRLDSLKQAVNKASDRRRTKYLGKSGAYDVYLEESLNTSGTVKTYFIDDQLGNLISFVAPESLRITAERRYAEVLELRYVFAQSLQPQQLEIDAAVTKFIDSLLQK